MKTTLSNSDMRLTAFIVQKIVTREVPHSAFHSLETTHMKTILSQLNGNEWYKTFSTLDPSESSAIWRLLHPMWQGKVQERELLVLKVIQENKTSEWMALLSEILRNRPFPRAGRVLLVICREKLVDGKPMAMGLNPAGEFIFLMHQQYLWNSARAETSFSSWHVPKAFFTLSDLSRFPGTSNLLRQADAEL